MGGGGEGEVRTPRTFPLDPPLLKGLKHYIPPQSWHSLHSVHHSGIIAKVFIALVSQTKRR